MSTFLCREITGFSPCACPAPAAAPPRDNAGGDFPNVILRTSPPLHAGLGGGRGKVRAFTSDWKFTLRWVPSQNGLFSECPHRQRLIAVRPDKSKALPVVSQIVNSPSTRIEPLLWMVIFAKLSSSIEGTQPGCDRMAGSPCLRLAPV